MEQQRTFDCIKAYDVRGVVPDTLDATVATRIAWALVEMLAPKNCVIGWDVRSHSPMLVDALSKALTQQGVDVMQLGLAGTEEVYYWAGEHQLDLGLMVTASHNPAEYNGIKIVRRGASPMIGEFSMEAVRETAERLTQPPKKNVVPGRITQQHDKDPFVQKLLSFVDVTQLKPLKIVINSGNGVAGPVIEKLSAILPFEIVHIQPEPDGTFPNGIPNPLLPEKRGASIDAVTRHRADLGVAFDGDFDRCFFFDEDGRFIEGYYIVGLLAEALLAQHPGGTVCYDPRLIWNTEAVVARLGGGLKMTQSGHTFLKAGMRESGAIYGGEMSAHHYFKDFYYCDSGMLPWLLVAQLISTQGKGLKALVDDMIQRFPCTGEVNFALPDRQAQSETIERISQHYQTSASHIDDLDGLSMQFAAEGWRFNVRSSNTEPLLRLNIETRANPGLAQAKLIEMTDLISGEEN